MRLLIFIIFYCGTLSIVTAQEEEEQDSPIVARAVRQGKQIEGRGCRFRRTPGVCKRRSECNEATRRVCRVGADPIVCCLDKPQEVNQPSVIFPQETPPQRLQPTTRRPSIIFPQETPSSRPRPSTRRPKPPPTIKPPPKPAPQKVPDLTFPGCGSRSPKVENTARTSGGSGRPPRRRGFLSRLGKRAVSYDVDLYMNPNVIKKRFKRQLIRPVIVGGVVATPNSWPWMTAIFKKSATSRFLCGASLISRHYVISAAHCFDSEQGNIDPSKFSVSVGAHNTRDGTEYAVESIKIHPGYKERQYYNDLSILKTTQPVKLTNKVYPVCMPQPTIMSRIVTHQNVTVTGWGDTSFGGVGSKVLREVSFPIVPLRQCNASYAKTSRSTFPRGITDELICAGVEEGGKDACQGDSGGPLVMNTVEDKWVQVGVVSFGYGCAQPGFPGVYTRVEKFTRWLYENSDLGRQ